MQAICPPRSPTINNKKMATSNASHLSNTPAWKVKVKVKYFIIATLPISGLYLKVDFQKYKTKLKSFADKRTKKWFVPSFHFGIDNSGQYSLDNLIVGNRT